MYYRPRVPVTVKHVGSAKTTSFKTLAEAARFLCKVQGEPVPPKPKLDVKVAHLRKTIADKRDVRGWVFSYKDDPAPSAAAGAPPSAETISTDKHARPSPAPAPAKSVADFRGARVTGHTLASVSGPGVYVLGISNDGDDRVKIGSTRDFRERLQTHIADGMDVREWVSFHSTIFCNEVENEIKKRLRHHNTPVVVGGKRRTEIFSGICPTICAEVASECVDEFEAKNANAHEYKMIQAKIRLAEVEARKLELQLELETRRAGEKKKIAIL